MLIAKKFLCRIILDEANDRPKGPHIYKKRML